MSTPQIIPVIASRDLFPEVLNQSGLRGVGVEVGVLKAVLEFAEKIQRDVLVSSEAFPPPFEAPSWFIVKA